MSKIGKRAVIIGAGMSGLAAAGALAGRFDEVIVLERDHLPDEPTYRLGAQQGRHVHVLLAAGQQALETLFPGFTQAMVDGGAVVTRANADIRVETPGHDPFPQRDLGWVSYSLSRPLIEFTARQLAMKAGVEFRDGQRVRRLEASPDGAAIVAVHVEGPKGEAERVEAELVVDASGRATPTLELLKALGRPAPEETVIGVDFAYASAVFETPADAPSDWKILMTMPKFGESLRGGLLAPIENGRWIVSLGGRADDTPTEDIEGFMAFAKGLRTPTLYNAIRDTPRIGDPVRFGFRQSTRRRFAQLAPLPRGLVPIGDSFCRFNPVYGQGMTVAAQQAVLLNGLLEERSGAADPLADLSEAFVRDADALVEGPWRMSALPDLALPETRGERPAELGAMLQFGAALAELAARDPEVHKLDAEVRQLMRPMSDLTEPGLVQRVLALMAEMQGQRPA